MTEEQIRRDEQDKVIDRLKNWQPAFLIELDHVGPRGWHSWKFAKLVDAVRGDLKRNLS